MHNLLMVFPFLMSNWSYIEQVKIFLKFSSKVSSEGSYLNRIAKSTPAFELLIDVLAKKNEGVMAI